jgi:IS30 family transposase
MKKQRKALTLEIRQSIWVMSAAGIGIRETGRRLKIDPSIVSRELRRNRLPIFVSTRLSALERAKEAHQKAKRRCKEKRRGKRKARPLMSIFEHIAKKLSEGYSPEAIANTIERYFPTLKLSTSTIYRMIKHDAPELIKHLPEHGKKRRQRIMNRRGRFQQAAPAKRHKSERPAEADNRSEIGHLEGDSILSKRGSKVSVLSLCDRMTRKRWYIEVKDLQAETIRKALVSLFHSLPAYARKTLTLDRGSEFAEWDMLEKIFKELQVYFCTAYSPYEKGSVERSNRDFRRDFPKGTDFAMVPPEQIQQTQDKFNNKPMKCLKWGSPDELYKQEVERLELEIYQKAA